MSDHNFLPMAGSYRFCAVCRKTKSHHKPKEEKVSAPDELLQEVAGLVHRITCDKPFSECIQSFDACVRVSTALSALGLLKSGSAITPPLERPPVPHIATPADAPMTNGIFQPAETFGKEETREQQVARIITAVKNKALITIPKFANATNFDGNYCLFVMGQKKPIIEIGSETTITARHKPEGVHHEDLVKALEEAFPNAVIEAYGYGQAEGWSSSFNEPPF